MNKQELASRIWESANKLRSSIEPSDYKDVILGLIFYKFVSEKEIDFLKSEDWKETDFADLREDNEETVNYLKDNIGYFISYNDLFSTWLTLGMDFQVSMVSDAITHFEINISKNYLFVYKDIFNTLQTNLSKLGSTTGEQTKVVKGVIDQIKDIPMDSKQDYDVLGFIYEYLLSMFANDAGKKAGEFYTPHEASVLMSKIIAHHLKDRKEIKIYDPTSGSGSLLITIGKSVAEMNNDPDQIKYYAQELIPSTYNLTRMNLIMRGILPSNIKVRNADTLEKDWPRTADSEDESENQLSEVLTLDAVVSNPPYSHIWSPEGKKNDPRYADYGLAPQSKADYAFLLHDLYHLKNDGIMTIVLPHGVLFRGGEEGKIRQNLIEKDNIETIIGLPANMFYGTGIPTIIMVLKKHRESNDVLFIDASKHFLKCGKKNKLQASDIKRIYDAVISREPGDGKFSRLVSKEEIRTNGYNLNIPRYVDSSEPIEKWNLNSLMNGGIPDDEINDFSKYWKAFPSLKEQLFKEGELNTSSLKVNDIRQTITNNLEVIDFRNKFQKEFADLNSYLYNELLLDPIKVHIQGEEDKIAISLFSRNKFSNLIDNYDIYQKFDDTWRVISNDLEILQSKEGLGALKAIDESTPKKDSKKGKVTYFGRVLPFDLVQKVLLSKETKELSSLNSKSDEINSKLSELLDELPEDDKETSPCIDEEGDKFINDEVKKAAKKFQKEGFEKDSFEAMIVDANKLIEELKSINKKIRTGQKELLNKTIFSIKNVTIDDAKLVLKEKWITPVVNSINSLLDNFENDCINKLVYLGTKYSSTLPQIDSSIAKTEKELSSLLKDLDGDEQDSKGLKELLSILGDSNHE